MIETWLTNYQTLFDLILTNQTQTIEYQSLAKSMEMDEKEFKKKYTETERYIISQFGNRLYQEKIK